MEFFTLHGKLVLDTMVPGITEDVTWMSPISTCIHSNSNLHYSKYFLLPCKVLKSC